jgi:hypothetical protein
MVVTRAYISGDRFGVYWFDTPSRAAKGNPMTTWYARLALAGLLVAVAGGAAAAVTVTFAHPDDYVSMPLSAKERTRVYEDLTDHFEKLMDKLPKGTDLHVEVIDLELAGRIESVNRAGQEVRSMREGVDWPRMALRYTFTRGNTVVAQGEDQISNMNYLGRLRRVNDQTLIYEKQMISDWFRSVIASEKLAVR